MSFTPAPQPPTHDVVFDEERYPIWGWWTEEDIVWPMLLPKGGDHLVTLRAMRDLMYINSGRYVHSTRIELHEHQKEDS